MALATVNTHDLAPLVGWWRGRDVALRHTVGQGSEHGDPADLRRAQHERDVERRRLLDVLVGEGLLDETTGERAAADPEALGEARLVAAVHALVRRTPSWLVGLSLDDVVGEPEPVNLPGVGGDRFASWTRRLSLPLESLDRLGDRLAFVLGVERAPPAG
jgi:4-alpha-glucanotransferase